MNPETWLEMIHQFPIDSTPHFGLCDYPAQFGIKCPHYVGAVKFYQVRDPDFLVWGSLVSEKSGHTGYYIGNAKLSAVESFPLHMHDGSWVTGEYSIPKIDQLWCFETQSSQETFISFPTKLIYFSLGIPRTIRG